MSRTPRGTVLGSINGQDFLANAAHDLAAGNVVGAGLNAAFAGMEAASDSTLVEEKKIADVLGKIADYLGEGAGPPIINDAGEVIVVSGDSNRSVQFHIINPKPHTSPHAHVAERTPSSNMPNSDPIIPSDLPHF